VTRPAGRITAVAAGGTLALALLETSRALAGLPFSLSGLAGRALFAIIAIAASRTLRPRRARGRWIVPASALAATGALALSGGAAALGSTAGAWIALGLFFALTLAAALPSGERVSRGRSVTRIFVLSAVAGIVPMAALELACRFAHEEIFVLLAALLLAAVWLLLVLAASAWPSRNAPVRGIAIRPGALVGTAILLAAAGSAAAISAYQESFFEPHPPPFPGISADAPFLCGRSAPSSGRFDARQVFDRLIARVAENPDKGTPELGMLALATGDRAWGGCFRESLLAEIAEGQFSRRGKTKFWQYGAALRAYYFPRVAAGYPELFSPGELLRARAWFGAINRRALAVGWDDLVYAAAYRKRPEGPYENQENGAALLAILEVEHLAEPRLSAANRRYLDRASRGWQARSRNSDDAFSYQSEWITNAYLQSLRTGARPPAAVRRSFDWLLLQTPPDGFAPDYNPSGPPRLPGSAYFGASLLRDPAFLWLAAKSVRSFEARGLPVWAQPGVERFVDLPALSPEAGSCLLYGESGLPNRPGPLSPDKIVFRGGWNDADPYLLLDLRFEGWHRYRATNTIPLLRARGETLVSEEQGNPFSFLPIERRLFRDKRIPRENLNGLLVEPRGIAAAVSGLAGFGGAWAQDPPRVARVESFAPVPGGGRSVSVVAGWNGWTHRRSIAFEPGGPIVVLDDARGPANESAVAWHVEGSPDRAAGRYRLGASGSAELILVPLDAAPGRILERHRPDTRGLDLTYLPPHRGRLGLASVFLVGPWRGASVALAGGIGGRRLEVTGANGAFSLELPREAATRRPE